MVNAEKFTDVQINAGRYTAAIEASRQTEVCLVITIIFVIWIRGIEY